MLVFFIMKEFLSLQNINKNFKKSEEFATFLKREGLEKEKLDNFEYLESKDAFDSYENNKYLGNSKINNLKKVLDLQRQKNNLELNLYKEKIEEQFEEIAMLEEELNSLKYADDDMYYV